MCIRSHVVYAGVRLSARTSWTARITPCTYFSSPSSIHRACIVVRAPPSHCGGLSRPLTLHVSQRTSQVTSFKQPGYFRLPIAKQIVIDPSVYEVHTMRGSGPGGQGTNSSSNKVELRVDVELLADSFDEAIIASLRHGEVGRSITADGATLIVRSHAHRSALQNKEDCLQQVRELLHKASWVPPVDADPVQLPAALISRKKTERRHKGNTLRMRRTARQGLW